MKFFSYIWLSLAHRAPQVGHGGEYQRSAGVSSPQHGQGAWQQLAGASLCVMLARWRMAQRGANPGICNPFLEHQCCPQRACSLAPWCHHVHAVPATGVLQPASNLFVTSLASINNSEGKPRRNNRGCATLTSKLAELISFSPRKARAVCVCFVPGY